MQNIHILWAHSIIKCQCIAYNCFLFRLQKHIITIILLHIAVRSFSIFFFTLHVSTESAPMSTRSQAQSDCRSWFDNGLNICIVEQT